MALTSWRPCTYDGAERAAAPVHRAAMQIIGGQFAEASAPSTHHLPTAALWDGRTNHSRVASEVGLSFAHFKRARATPEGRAIFFRLQGDEVVVVAPPDEILLCDGGLAEVLAMTDATLLDDQCAYVVLRVDYATAPPDNTHSWEKRRRAAPPRATNVREAILFLTWTPDTADLPSRIAYADAREHLKTALRDGGGGGGGSGVDLCLTVTRREDLLDDEVIATALRAAIPERAPGAGAGGARSQAHARLRATPSSGGSLYSSM